MVDIQFIESLSEITASEWNGIAGTDYPFMRHEFLSALEDCGVATASKGWRPQHVLVHDKGQLIAVMPLYLKSHSYGEYVFDFSWADAYQRQGLDYYPKLVSAIPYTPASGPRLCVREERNKTELVNTIFQSVKNRAMELSASSWHLLFPEQTDSQIFSGECSQRIAVHFQWRNPGFNGFDDFLATLNSRKRKNLRKERQRVIDQRVTFERWRGKDISAELWRTFYYFYQLTYAKHSGHSGYLNQNFFQKVAANMPEHIVLIMALHNDEYIAGALNFCDSQTLYGRYWGCLREIECLHFETCYYQGIEYCIEQGLQRFDPGVQGEHKILRGFRPVYTYSNHWIADPLYRQAIDHFLEQETRKVAEYRARAEAYLPFKAN